MTVDEAIAQLVRESGDRLLRLAFQLCRDRAEAEDIVQEAVERVYGSWLRRRQAVDSVEGYVRRAVVNEYLRRRRRRDSTEVVAADITLAPAPPFETDVVERDRLWTAIGTLPARQRAVLILRYYEDLPDAEIAVLVRCKPATVRSIAARALAALRDTDIVEESR